MSTATVHPGRLHLLRARSGALRLPRPGAARSFLAAGFAMVVLAVALQAQLVAGQDSLEELNAARVEASELGADLRASVAAAESPANVLAAAEEMGMVRPAAAVAVPAAPNEHAAVPQVDGSAGSR